MVKPLHRRLVPAVLCAAASAALAQTAPPEARPARPDPLDPTAEVPALRYRTSLNPARGAEAGKPLAWRDANEQVGRVGGWRAYAREAQAVPAPTGDKGQAGHAGHAGHDGAKIP